MPSASGAAGVPGFVGAAPLAGRSAPPTAAAAATVPSASAASAFAGVRLARVGPSRVVGAAPWRSPARAPHPTPRGGGAGGRPAAPSMGLFDSLKKAVGLPADAAAGGDGGDPDERAGAAVGGDAVDLAANARLLEQYGTLVTQVTDRFESTEALSDEEIRAAAAALRARLSAASPDGATVADLDGGLGEAFALAREAAYRTVGLCPYDVQLLGGVALHRGNVAEMATGEGKTLVAVLPTVLAAMAGRGTVLVVTVNDYLARRDAEFVTPIHEALGLTVGLVQAGDTPAERRAAYAADVTYVTNSELGFDYLRDNLALTADDLVLGRPFYYCLVDEADSVLVDEARTPLIISESVDAPAGKYAAAAKVANALTVGVHYTANVKEQSVLMTDRGYADIERALGVDDLFNPADPWAPYLINALKAKELFKRDTNYLVRDTEVVIIDEFTGRAMEGRRWSDGLHQAVEAAEGIPVASEASTVASISYQAFFRLFPRLAGMTGTAATEATEFGDIYSLRVVPIPTALPVARKDYPDAVFKTPAGKYKAVMREVARAHPSGRPLLLGTTSVEASEQLSALLGEVGVPHEVLNAKAAAAQREGEIIAQAARRYAVTIATNMAGRGTDIVLGGNPEYYTRALARRALVRRSNRLAKALETNDSAEGEGPISFYVIDDAVIPGDGDGLTDATREALDAAAGAAFKGAPRSLQTSEGIDTLVSVAAGVGGEAETDLAALSKKTGASAEAVAQLASALASARAELKAVCAAEQEAVVELGGLYVIGTERHESRRIDNQLRGRSGRQGDPGASRFFVSLEDRLFKTFGGDKLQKLLTVFRVDEDTPIESKSVTSALNSAQAAVEVYYSDIRKQLFTYDEVLSVQRAAIYAQRRRLLTAGDHSMDTIYADWCAETAAEIVPNYVTADAGGKADAANYPGLDAKLHQFFPNITGVDEASLSGAGRGSAVADAVAARVAAALTDKTASLNAGRSGKDGGSFASEVERFLALSQADAQWREHLKKMDYLKEFVGLRAYGSDDPLVAYQREGFALFEALMAGIRRNAVYSLFQYEPTKKAAAAAGGGKGKKKRGKK